MIDPAKITEIKKEELVEELIKLSQQEEEIKAEKEEIKNEILARLRDDGEVWGRYSVTRVKRPNYAKVTIETARLLGAVKEAVDTMALRNLHRKGIEIEGLTESVYPLVKSLEEKKE